jgi:hypothetical protein
VADAVKHVTVAVLQGSVNAKHTYHIDFVPETYRGERESVAVVSQPGAFAGYDAFKDIKLF